LGVPACSGNAITLAPGRRDVYVAGTYRDSLNAAAGLATAGGADAFVLNITESWGGIMQVRLRCRAYAKTERL
jgi:hypothetical protein